MARLKPLVDSGAASQGQLDGERALYEQAQRRLTEAQETKRNAEGALLAARQPNQSQVNVRTPREQIVSAVSSSTGKVVVINVRVGDLVSIGEPPATIRADTSPNNQDSGLRSGYQATPESWVLTFVKDRNIVPPFS